MGHLYTNYLIENACAHTLAEKLRPIGRECFVYQLTSEFVLVYDSKCESQDSEEITSFGATLSVASGTRIVGSFNHDDDQLLLKTFEDGREIDQYNSSPGLWGDESEIMGGNTELLAQILRISNAAQLDRVLRTFEFAFAFERHMAIVELAGLEVGPFICGWVDIKRKDGPSEDMLRAIIEIQ